MMKGYKGFNPDWTCRDFKFEIGQKYKHEGEVSLCNSGFHFCENPLDVLTYYPPTGKFAEVEADDVCGTKSDDSKRASKIISIKSEISLHMMIKLGLEFIMSKVDFKNAPVTNTGDRSAASNTGDRSAASNTGDRSAASNTGYQSAASNTGDQSAASNTGDRSAASNTGYQSAASVSGKESVAIVTGKDSKASGEIGCWIVLTERNYNYEIVSVKAFKVDGKKIKANVFYTLRNGKAIKA